MAEFSLIYLTSGEGLYLLDTLLILEDIQTFGELD